MQLVMEKLTAKMGGAGRPTGGNTDGPRVPTEPTTQDTTPANDIGLD